MSKLIHLEVFRGQVDRKNGVIRGVSLIRVGPAKGHEMDIDVVTLENVMKLFPQVGLKAKINHRDNGGVRSINGRFQNPRIEDGHFRADWHVLDAHPDTEWLYQLAENQPEDCGISLSCRAKEIRGTDGRNKMRVTELYSGDLVDDPAANETLLEAGGAVDTKDEGMEIKELAEKFETFCKKQEETITELSAKVNKFDDFAKKLTETLAGTEEGDSEGKELSAFKEAITELSTKLEAMGETIKTVGQKPAPASGTDTQLSQGSKTEEEKTLETKLTDAKTQLEKAFGLAKTELAAKFEKEFGSHWKTRLVELQAKK